MSLPRRNIAISEFSEFLGDVEWDTFVEMDQQTDATDPTRLALTIVADDDDDATLDDIVSLQQALSYSKALAALDLSLSDVGFIEAAHLIQTKIHALKIKASCTKKQTKISDFFSSHTNP